MQNDEMIWQVINHQFCSFKTTVGRAKSDKTNFCRHPYSVTGLCNRTSCPLANSKYATLREDNGKVYLCIKTVERAHSPKNLWEKILLSRNYTKALQQLDTHLAYYPTVLVHRNKQRLTKIHQYLIRMRKLKLRELSGRKAKLVRVHRKIEQREERREKKALVAAKLETSIEKELVERLARGTYGDIYNFPEAPYQKALRQAQDEEEKEGEEEEEYESESEEEEGMVEYVEDLDEEDEEEEDVEDLQYMGEGEWGEEEESEEEMSVESESEDSDEEDSDEESSSSSDEEKKRHSRKKVPQKKPRARGTRVEIEYEEENEPETNAMAQSAAAW